MQNPEPDPAVEYETTVKLFVEGAPTEWIACAIVCLYDRDRISRDDFLGTEMTNTYGEATFRFTEAQFLDLDERLGGSLPELYVKVFGADGECVLSTRVDATRNTVPALIRVPVDRELAHRHGLI